MGVYVKMKKEYVKANILGVLGFVSLLLTGYLFESTSKFAFLSLFLILIFAALGAKVLCTECGYPIQKSIRGFWLGFNFDGCGNCKIPNHRDYFNVSWLEEKICKFILGFSIFGFMISLYILVASY